MADREFSYEIYISHTQEVCIVGKIENDLICAPSFSTVSDLKRTQAIIEKIASGASASVSTTFPEYDEIKRNWYRLNLSQAMLNGKLLYHLSENPGGHFDRSFLADQIKEIFEILSKTGMVRLADGAYLPVLRYFHEFLAKHSFTEKLATDDYDQIQPLFGIIKGESYLKLSPYSDIRDLYKSIAEYLSNFSDSCISDGAEATYENNLYAAKARLAGGAYLPVLRSYQVLLSKYDRHDQQAVEYYYEMKPLIGIVESESYLTSSSDAVVRDLYKSLAVSASELYSAHMSTRG
jgi:hypothetical protein